ncbi:hypothetical protein S83_017094 [Arachis hypogaea]|nr:Translation initiation factor [Arachis hypogaea]
MAWLELGKKRIYMNISRALNTSSFRRVAGSSSGPIWKFFRLVTELSTSHSDRSMLASLSPVLASHSRRSVLASSRLIFSSPCVLLCSPPSVAFIAPPRDSSVPAVFFDVPPPSLL